MNTISEDPEPVPSDRIPKYVREGLDRQDALTLLDIASYCEELAEHKRHAVSEDDIDKEGVEGVTPVDEDEDFDVEDIIDEEDDPEAARKGSVVVRRTKCGSDCKCNNGTGHGPYAYLVWSENGSQKWKYVGKA
ncbi:DUF6788 family protein [Haloarcula brevis]|uniref:DUF6788 family protein n=1 Tax=Haloarcula brevis TaxID=3111453 RepID=UPI00300F3D52